MSSIIKNIISPVFSKLIAPITSCKEENPYSRSCSSIADIEWLQIGLLRVIGEMESGRGFLQNLFHKSKTLIDVSHFFQTLKSKRRLNYVRHTLDILNSNMKKLRSHLDPFSKYKELDNFNIYAGDGHHHKASTHEDRLDGKKYAPEHFYSLDMRIYSLNQLCLAESCFAEDRKGEHDTRALKRMDVKTLRQGAAIGRQCLYIWDRGGLDFPLWEKYKSCYGIYFLSRTKKNLILKKKESLDFDKKDPVNNGVISNEIVISSCGVEMRRISYLCPFTNKTYTYVTNLSKKIRPGLVAFLYKVRWDIEKKFDLVKNKMHEKKAWGKSEVSKTMQALFICIAHNLSLVLEDEAQKEGVVNDHDEKRRENRLNHNIRNSKISEDKISIMVKTIQRVTQLPLKFFRWLRAYLFDETQWWDALDDLRLSYIKFE